MGAAPLNPRAAQARESNGNQRERCVSELRSMAEYRRPYHRFNHQSPGRPLAAPSLGETRYPRATKLSSRRSGSSTSHTPPARSPRNPPGKKSPSWGALAGVRAPQFRATGI